MSANAMASTPWVIRQSKRKPSTTTPATRKRVRISDDVGGPQSSNARLTNQKTLTQIQWVNSPDNHNEDDLDMQEIGLDRQNSTGSVRSRGSKAKKRNSTLTQMDWLGKFSVHEDDELRDTEMLPQNTSIDIPAIPHVDGTSDAPAPSKPEKHTLDDSRELPRASSPATPRHETQNYRPTKKRKENTVLDRKNPGARRRSARIASKVFSDIDEVHQFISDSHTSPQQQERQAHKGISRPPVLEIMDSFEPEETASTQTSNPLATPRKQREVASSQTPETLTRTKRHLRHDSEYVPSKTNIRTPLQERSRNIMPGTLSRRFEASELPSKSMKLSPKRNKVCVLKAPSRELLNRPQLVEDSQHDIYSLRGTSSAHEVSEPSDEIASDVPTVIIDRRSQEAMEIPSTSQRLSDSDRELPSSPPLDTQGTLPELSDLLPPRKVDMLPLPYEQSRDTIPRDQDLCQSSIAVKDFVGTGSQEVRTLIVDNERNPTIEKATDDGDMLLDHETGTNEQNQSLINSTSAGPLVDIDDLNSPAPRETKLREDLLQRTLNSKPTVTMSAESQSLHTTNLKAVTPRRSLRRSGDGDVNAESPMPTPRLVEHVPCLTGHEEPEETSNRVRRSMLPPSVPHLENHASSTMLALNDTITRPSSSPSLPPARFMRQRSIHPASMPRPSQVSTQEPTQNYSLPPIRHHTQHQSTDRITVKDSSDVHLSQIPQHESQSQGSNLRPIVDSDDDVDDIDLDPPSVTYGRYSARKPATLKKKETGSSMRSIHPPASTPRGRKKADNSRSSPLLKTKDSTRTDVSSSPRMERTGPTEPHAVVYDSEATSSSPISSPFLPPLKRKYDPLPGFNNETQSNFTQNGHISAAFVRRQQEEGTWPDWLEPEPFFVEGSKQTPKRKKVRS